MIHADTDVSSPANNRSGWETYDLGDGNYISFPQEAQPYIIWKHIDGPYLTCRDGTPHFLTWWERFALCFWFITIRDLDQKYGRYAQLKKL